MDGVVEGNPHLFLGSRLKRLGDRMQADAAAFTGQAGLSVPPGLFSVLATLDAQTELSVGALASALGVTQPSMTKAVTKLADAGLVAVSRPAADRRQAIVALTETGIHAVAVGRRSIWPMVDAAVQEVTHDLPGSFIAQIAEIERRLDARSISERASSKIAVDLQPATDDALPAIAALLNRAYRGADSGAGWNSEAALIDGDRTTVALLHQERSDYPDATLLVWRFGEAIQGCVWLKPEGDGDGDGDWYLGSLAVDPRLQNGGAGRRLLAAAEAWARARGGTRIRMTVVHVRDTLIAWYARRGYRPTGDTEPFPYADERFGRPKRPDLHFIVLTKSLAEERG
ncbi:hypothetical protein SR41_07030 [Sphingomonas melonis]|uniref:GNAT family acetyltransferase n=1 Tax=Sphingomonas melonis TaxID=152682 RepID=A0A0D1K4X5_9SPHN|nr:GNAT family N-acetyltransferase [Sphingomonas melonis]KIU28638.1 hypothetical protein SR41_07030 [Sphingomonas melonis]